MTLLKGVLGVFFPPLAFFPDVLTGVSSDTECFLGDVLVGVLASFLATSGVCLLGEVLVGVLADLGVLGSFLAERLLDSFELFFVSDEES